MQSFSKLALRGSKFGSLASKSSKSLLLAQPAVAVRQFGAMDEINRDLFEH